MKVVLFALLFSVSAFAETKVSPAVLKARSGNSSQWEQCKKAYKSYVGLVREKIKENKVLTMSDLKKIESKTSPDLETLVPCQASGFFTDAEELISQAEQCV